MQCMAAAAIHKNIQQYIVLLQQLRYLATIRMLGFILFRIKCYACKASVMLAKQALAGFQFKSKQPIVGSKGTIAGANRMQAII